MKHFNTQKKLITNPIAYTLGANSSGIVLDTIPKRIKMSKNNIA